MSSLRFCFFTTFYPPYSFGGDAVAVERLARGLVRAGHHVTVVHDRDAHSVLDQAPAPRALAPAPARARDADAPDVVTLATRAPAVSVLLTQQLGRPVFNGRRIARILAQGRFDVINYHNVSLVGGPGLLGIGTGVKVYTAHEHWLVCPTHVLWKFGREVCTERACVRCQLTYRRPPQWWRMGNYMRRQLAHVDAFIAMSEFSREKHREFGFPYEMHVVPAFVPAAPVTGTAPPGERPYFLMLGRLEPLKGMQDVVPVFRDQDEADLIVAGRGSFERELVALAARSPRVQFLGHLEHAELARYIKHAVAVIVPSRCFETFGVVMLEAFRQGTPVIARRLGPFPEIVERAGAGEMFSTRDELVAALRRLRTDAAHRRALGDAAYTAYERHYSERVVIPRYLDVVRSASERRRAAAPRAARAGAT